MQRLLNAVENPIHRAVFALMYACGLRISEAQSLTVKTIDSKRGTLRIIESPEKSLQPVEFAGLCFSAKNGVFVNNFNMLREFSPDFFQGTHHW
ncbi:MAG: tyrosine-type recombinase/integrase [Magnetococcales bacterium]|nr:tyrosine-type recombinase/integrase [Magnetococcales bacterium]MBF0117012.1 tyrosine-type recombinase/integrase [Magnetococcales bacterium]